MFLRKNSLRSFSDPIKNKPVSGTLLQARAWAFANPMVVDHISLMISISEYRQQYLDLNMRERLSVADAVVLVHRLGLTKLILFLS